MEDTKQNWIRGYQVINKLDSSTDGIPQLFDDFDEAMKRGGDVLRIIEEAELIGPSVTIQAVKIFKCKRGHKFLETDYNNDCIMCEKIEYDAAEDRREVIQHNAEIDNERFLEDD